LSSDDDTSLIDGLQIHGQTSQAPFADLATFSQEPCQAAGVSGPLRRPDQRSPICTSPRSSQLPEAPGRLRMSSA